MTTRPPSSLALGVISCRRATPRSNILQLELDGARFPFHAGQAALVGRAGQPLRRPYSIASSPEDAAEAGILEFLVQIDAHGRLGEHLGRVRRGSRVIVEGPIGDFVMPDQVAERHVLFVAGGSGIAPLRSMLRNLLADRRPHRIAFTYSARSRRELAYASELKALADSGRIHLLLTTTRETGEGWRGHRGRIGRDALAALLAGHDPQCFLCGPPAFVRDLPALLVGLGVTARHIHTERWEPGRVSRSG